MGQFFYKNFVLRDNLCNQSNWYKIKDQKLRIQVNIVIFGHSTDITDYYKLELVLVHNYYKNYFLLLENFLVIFQMNRHETLSLR